MLKNAGIRRFTCALSFAGCCVTSHAQIKVERNPYAIAVDKNGAASTAITLKNTGNMALPLQLSITDFVHKERGKIYPLSSLPVLTPSTDADKQKIGSHQLPPNDSVDLKLTVSQLWDAGESSADLKNNGVTIDTIRVVRLPAAYNLQLDPSSAAVLLAPDSGAVVTIVNSDPMNYSFSWELVTRGKASSDPGQAIVTVPANGSVRIDLARVAPAISFVSAGTLKDDVVDSTLVLHPLIEAQDGVPPQAPKNLPLKLRLRFFRASFQEPLTFIWTLVLLGVGALASLFSRYFIPNAVGALRLGRQLRQMDAKQAGMGDGVASKWRVLMTAQIAACRAGLYDFPWYFPAFSTRLSELQGRADMVRSWVDVAYTVADVRNQLSALLQNGRMPPSVLELVERKCEEALQPIESGMTSADELQGMKMALKTAQDLVSAIRIIAPIPTLDVILQEREKRLTAGAIADLISAFPWFAGLLNQVLTAVGTPFSPTGYVDRDMLSRKAELLLEYRQLVLRLGGGVMAAQVGGAPAPVSGTLTRLQAGFPRLESYIAPDSDQSLQRARLFLTEMRQDFYTAALSEAVNSPQPALRIHADPSPIESGVPVHFSLRFQRGELNEIAAVQEWTCLWDFDDESCEETGWDAYHLFKQAGNRTVSVTIVDLKGNVVATAQKITQTYTITTPATPKRGWFQIPRMTPEAKIEVFHLAIVLSVALFGIFATARTKIESLGTFSAAAALVGLGFGADTLKNLIAQKATDK